MKSFDYVSRCASADDRFVHGVEYSSGGAEYTADVEHCAECKSAFYMGASILGPWEVESSHSEELGLTLGAYQTRVAKFATRLADRLDLPSMYWHDADALLSGKLKEIGGSGVVVIDD